MGSILSKIAEMEEDGTLPKFDPTNMYDILSLAGERGIKQQIMFDAMDIIRDNPNMSNEDAIIVSAKRWSLI